MCQIVILLRKIPYNLTYKVRPERSLSDFLDNALVKKGVYDDEFR